MAIDESKILTLENIFAKAQDAVSIGDGDYLYFQKSGASVFSRIEASIALQGGGQGSGGSNQNVTITEDESYFYININDNTPSLVTSASSLSMSGNNKTATFTVIGTNLTSNVSVSVSGTGFAVNPSSIPQSGGNVNQTVTVTYSGSESANGSIVVRSGNITNMISVSYSDQQEPVLSITPSQLYIGGAVGSQATGTITIKGIALNSDVTLVSSNSDFTLSTNSLTKAQVNFAGDTGIEITVTRSANASSTSATITATSGSLTASASVSWEEQEAVPSVDDIITKDGLKFKVLSVADSNTNGTLRVIHSSGEEKSGYVASGYTMQSINLSTIRYAGANYDIVSIGTSAFANCSSIRSITLGSTVKTVGQYAFYMVSSGSATTITLSEGLETISKQAFQNINVSSITIPSTVTTIGDSAFSGTSLTELVIPNGTTSIGNNTFNISTLRKVTFGTSNELAYRSIGFPFYSASKIEEIYCHCGDTLKVNITNAQCFHANVYTGATLYVPTGTKQLFLNNSNWAKFAEGTDRIVETTLLD